MTKKDYFEHFYPIYRLLTKTMLAIGYFGIAALCSQYININQDHFIDGCCFTGYNKYYQMF